MKRSVRAALTLIGSTVALALALLSCATTSSSNNPLAFKSAPLFGMIYDFDNRECAGVNVTVDGRASSTTDIDGRFVVPNLTRGVHTVLVSKSGYEPLKVVFDFESPTQVLYLKMYSFDELLGQAESALGAGEWLKAGLFLRRAQAVRSQDVVLGYLQAILAYKQKQYAAAAQKLNSLVASGAQDPYIYLALADLYQYRLGEPKLAIHSLESYLKLADNPDVERRLEALESADVSIAPGGGKAPKE